MRLPILLLLLPVVAAPGCWSPAANEVIVYTAHDSEFSAPIFADFTAYAGIAVAPKYDTESTKTVALANALIEESNRGKPRCDVFWNNEVLNTLRLEKRGLLEVYRSPSAAEFPVETRGPNGTWQGFAARARVLIVNTVLVPESERPKSIHDLTDPKWKGRTAIAKPLFGTTATHFACLFEVLGREEAEAFCRKLVENQVHLLGGNMQVADSVANGERFFGLTDTDDAIGMLEKGYPVAIVYPDRKDDELGTLFIPNTVAILKDCPHPQQARKLVDYLLMQEVEEKLAAGASAQIPLNPAAAAPTRVETPRTVHAMQVDFSAAAEHWDETAKLVQEVLLGK